MDNYNTSYTELLPQGLIEAEVHRLTQQGHSNIALKKATRSIARIIFDNVFNLFNFINTILGVVVFIASLHDPVYFKNLLFMGVVVANSAIYAYQEIRAKLTIDKLALLSQPQITLRRAGEERLYPVDRIVVGDVMKIEAGEQIPVDGTILKSDGLEVDESLLTGESDAIAKHVDDEVLSGSVVMSGFAYVHVTKVAKDTFSARIVTEAKKESRIRSPLTQSINKILKVISFIIFPLGALLLYHFYRLNKAQDSLRSIVSTAGLLVSMLPEGLVLLTSVAMAVGVVRLGAKAFWCKPCPKLSSSSLMKYAVTPTKP